jgi:hypothetical protein
MGVISLPANVETDRQNGVKASSVHVQGNFDTLLNAVNRKLEIDGSIVPTADIPMGNHKLTGVAAPVLTGDAANKGYVDNYACMLAGAQTVTGNKDFTGTLTAVTQATTDNSTKVATTKFVIDILKAIYPVGSVYIGTQNSCPMGAFFGTWTLVSSGRALWTGNGSNGNSTIAAGLPQITGSFASHNHSISGGTGCFVPSSYDGSAGLGGVGSFPGTMTFKASSSNSIYGNSSTVQPPAYVVNVWRRTA